MDEVDTGQPDHGPTLSQGGVLSAGARLRAAREAQGLSVADVGARTRIPLRHLEALERGDYASLPSPTYAVGFGRACARSVGEDEVEIARMVRTDLDRIGPRTPEYVPYETADPTRVPPKGIAVLGVGIALAILILVGIWYGTDWLRPGVGSGIGGSSISSEVPAATVAGATPAAAPGATPAAPTGGQVVLTANDEVWLRVYDADNKTLYLGTMKPGEAFTVPADARDPMINVGRPDKLAVTLNGSAVPPLGDGSRAIKDVKVDGAAIAARLAGAPAPGASPPGATPMPTPTSSSSPRSSDPGPRERSADRPAARPRRDTPRLSETQRANLEAASPSTTAPAASGNSTNP